MPEYLFINNHIICNIMENELWYTWEFLVTFVCNFFGYFIFTGTRVCQQLTSSGILTLSYIC